jgi:hypothetical protein
MSPLSQTLTIGLSGRSTHSNRPNDSTCYGGQILGAAAQADRVDNDAVTIKVKQEFTAKEKASGKKNQPSTTNPRKSEWRRTGEELSTRTGSSFHVT